MLRKDLSCIFSLLDLPDGGAGHVAQTIAEIKRL